MKGQLGFLDVVRRAAGLVQVEGRVSVRALRLEFDLGDDRLTDLIYELVDVRQVARRDGDVLVATRSMTLPESSAETEPSAPILPGVGDTDRRDLTVLFCDLVGSTELSTTMDSEDYGDAIRAYHEAATAVVNRFGGFVAQLLGDGLLVLFGYPEAQEHAPEYAVRAALEIVETVRALSRGLAVRVGVHFGPCVIRLVGAGGRQDTIVLGETPNTAARVQSIAEPGAVLLSDAMHRLVGGWFECEAAEAFRLKGLPDPILVHRVVRASRMRSRLEVRGLRGLTPFVGRDLERSQLFAAWQRARDGHGSVVLVSGEPGIGKSRLVHALREHVASSPHRWLEGSCTPFTHNTAFHPIVEVVERLLGFEPDDSGADRLLALERGLQIVSLASGEALALFAAFLSIPQPSPVELKELSADARRRRTVEGLVDGIVRLSADVPLVLLVEDLHWSDPSSMETLSRVIEKIPTARILLVATSRPEFEPPWIDLPGVESIALEPMTGEQSRQLVQAVLVRSLSDRVGTDPIVERAGGNPLFLEELSQTLLESDGDDVARGVREIPTTLQGSLLARLDRLGRAKAIAQIAAVIGREFSRDTMIAVTDQPGAVVDQALDRLTRTGLVHRVSASTYQFKHVLVQEAAGHSLLKSTRRELHARVLEVLRTRFPDRLAAEPEVAARHAEAAELPESAVEFYGQAADQAVSRSAYEEAFGHLDRALGVVERHLRGDDQRRHEARLRLAVGVLLLQVRGHSQPATRAAFERARALSREVGDDGSLASALVGLALASYAVAELDQAAALAEEALALGEKIDSVPHVLVALATLMGVAYFRGRFRASAELADRALQLYEPERDHLAVVRLIGDDSGITALSTSGWALHELGAPDAGLERCREAVRLATTLVSPFCITQAMMWEASLMAESDHPERLRLAEETERFAEKQGFPVFAGSAKFLVGYGRDDPDMLLAGASEVAATGTLLMGPIMYCYLAATYLRIDRLDDAAGAIDAGMAISAATGQRSHDAQLLRLRGERCLRAAGSDERERTRQAEDWFRQSLAVATEQESAANQLHAAVSVGRMLKSGARAAEIRPLLEPIHRSFTDGSETPLMREAAALLTAVDV